jgi:hypothetical protein
MRAVTRTLSALLVGLGAASPGCREQPPPPTRAELEPPTWSVARDAAAPGHLLIDVRASTPCRVLARFEGVAERAMSETVRTFVAGETARLSVRTQVESEPRSSVAVLPADVAAGRTEAWVARLEAAWDDGHAVQRREVVGTRPGRGRAHDVWFAIPPRDPRPLPFGKDVDLSCVGIVDGGVDVVVEGREAGSRVRGNLDAAQGDRATLLRVVLRADKASP